MGAMEADPLQVVAVETERYVARGGWDQPARLFALVPTHELAASAPSLDGAAEAGPQDLSAVEQDGFDPGDDLQGALLRIMWPDAVHGVALSIERIVLPPAAEADLADGDSIELLQNHPERKDVRLVVAVLRGGQSICLLRQRAYDSDDMVAMSPDLASGLAEALAATLSEDAPQR